MSLLTSKIISLYTADGVLSDNMAVELISQSFDIRSFFGVSVQAIYNGLPQGTLTLEATNKDPTLPITYWLEIPNSPFAVTSAGSFLWNLTQAFYSHIRLRYTPTGGSGTLEVHFTGKA